MITYQSYVTPYLNRFVSVTISIEKAIRIKSFAKSIIKKKITESHHRIDNHQELKRWYTGFSGEAALEQLLGVEFIDFTIGDSKYYHVSDLSSIGVDIGVKTVEYGKFPVIFKKSKKPQVIILKQSDIDFLICGLATIEVLNQYQSDSLILSPALKKRGTKTGFYGFSALQIFKSMEELRNLQVL